MKKNLDLTILAISVYGSLGLGQIAFAGSFKVDTHNTEQLECTIYNRETKTSSKAIITYGGPFFKEITKATDLDIWYKKGVLKVFTSNQKVLQDSFVKVQLERSGELNTLTSFSGMWAEADLASGRFDAFKWGFWMNEISCSYAMTK